MNTFTSCLLALSNSANDLVKLLNGSSPTSGRLEVYHHGNWGTVCDTDFDDREANVVCRILGYFFGSPYALEIFMLLSSSLDYFVKFGFKLNR
jgi:hypothetical protein